MEAANIPAKFQVPWASSAGGSYIRTVPLAPPAQNGAASLQQGFPPATFEPLAAGGAGPFGADTNGILNQVTAWLQWVQAGGGIPPYDATFQGEIGGYPNGAVVASVTTPGLYWRSTADNNTSDPDTSGPNWVEWPTIATSSVLGISKPDNFSIGLASAGVLATLIGGSFVADGYLDIPIGGTSDTLIIQWGTTGAIATGTAVSLPKAFPTGALFSISAIAGFSASATNPYGTGSSCTSTQITLYTASSNSPAAFVWLAIGY